MNQAFEFEAKEIELKNLLLDPNNYRFLDHKKFKRKVADRFHEAPVQTATLDSLESTYQLDELRQSILTNGYVPMERIVVAPYAPDPTLYLVVEGNRRVAALKTIIRDADDGAISLKPAQRKMFERIPCVVLKSTGQQRKHAERVIMGIRHIAGAREWGAYQQALLVGELKDEENLEFKEIGDMLGISSVEAARRYRAVGALKAMEKDELYSKKAEPAFYRLFHELVSLPDVRERFGWSSELNGFKDAEQSREFFQLITSDTNHEPKLITYGDVRKLKSIVGNKLAEDCLFDSERTFAEAIRIAETGKKIVSASTILSDAKKALDSIGVADAGDLNSVDLARIDELIVLLKKIKAFAAKAKK